MVACLVTSVPLGPAVGIVLGSPAGALVPAHLFKSVNGEPFECHVPSMLSLDPVFGSKDDSLITVVVNGNADSLACTSLKIVVDG